MSNSALMKRAYKAALASASAQAEMAIEHIHRDLPERYFRGEFRLPDGGTLDVTIMLHFQPGTTNARGQRLLEGPR